MNKIKLYHFYFEGRERPVTIETDGNKELARRILIANLNKLPEAKKREFKGRKIISETISTPVTGISAKTENGRRYLWDGTKGGWQPAP